MKRKLLKKCDNCGKDLAKGSRASFCSVKCHNIFYGLYIKEESDIVEGYNIKGNKRGGLAPGYLENI